MRHAPCAVRHDLRALLQEKIDHLAIPFTIVGTPLTAIMVSDSMQGRAGHTHTQYGMPLDRRVDATRYG